MCVCVCVCVCAKKYSEDFINQISNFPIHNKAYQNAYI